MVLACDGCFVGYPAVISLVVITVVLIGSIFMLLWSNFGARKGYLITMVALGIWMIIMSAMWLFGQPGTAPATGPRGREPQWIPFTPTSEVARQDFPEAVRNFPSEEWDRFGEVEIYPGDIDPAGELETIRSVVSNALARLAEQQEQGPTDPDAWLFRPAGLDPATPDEEEMPEATVAFRAVGDTLLFGARIPATDLHPETTVFAYRDRGLVFLWGLYFLVASLLLFGVHLWLLVRIEQREKRAQGRLEPATA